MNKGFFKTDFTKKPYSQNTLKKSSKLRKQVLTQTQFCANFWLELWQYVGGIYLLQVYTFIGCLETELMLKLEGIPKLIFPRLLNEFDNVY